MPLSGFVRQKTLKNTIRCRGVALHSGERVAMAFHPADPDTGIVFRRGDRGGAALRATWRRVRESTLCTTLDDGDGLQVATVEHVMAALAGLEIDNAVVELDGPEVPAMDGSAAPFVFLLECAGLVEQDAPRRAIEILRPVRVGGDAGKSAALLPGDGLTKTGKLGSAVCDRKFAGAWDFTIATPVHVKRPFPPLAAFKSQMRL